MSEREKLIEYLNTHCTDQYGEIISWAVADFILEREDKIRRCEFCGSNDLVCGKAWKDEREKLLAEMKADRNRICEPLVKALRYSKKCLNIIYETYPEIGGENKLDGLNKIDQAIKNAGIVGREG